MLKLLLAFFLTIPLVANPELDDLNLEGSGIFLSAAMGYNTSEHSHTSKKLGGSKSNGSKIFKG